jgi:hypothetical protein
VVATRRRRIALPFEREMLDDIPHLLGSRVLGENALIRIMGKLARAALVIVELDHNDLGAIGRNRHADLRLNFPPLGNLRAVGIADRR